MKNEKLKNIMEGCLLIVLGILIAIFRGEAVLTTYLGIVMVIVGSLLLAFEVFLLAKKLPLNIPAMLGGPALIALAIGLLTSRITIGFFIDAGVIAAIGLGAGLVLLAVYSFVKKNVPLGVTEAVLGIVAIVIGSLYIANISGFQTAFWIVLGVLIACAGVLTIIFQFVDKPKLKK